MAIIYWSVNVLWELRENLRCSDNCWTVDSISNCASKLIKNAKFNDSYHRQLRNIQLCARP